MEPKSPPAPSLSKRGFSSKSSAGLLCLVALVLLLPVAHLAQSASGAFTYDSLNRLTCATLDGSTIQYQYDAAGNLLRVWTPYTLSVTKAGPGTGVVIDDQGKVDCGVSCTAVYASGAPVLLVPIPDAGMYFAGWLGACSGVGSCAVTVSGALTAVATFTNVPPTYPPPTGLAAIPGNTQASLTWDAVVEPDLAGYNVYRGTVSGGPYVKVNGPPVIPAAYTDMGLINGTMYFYAVSAVGLGGAESTFSAEASVVPDGPPAAPVDLVALGRNTRVKLLWAPTGEEDVGGYNIYRSASAGGAYAKVNATPVPVPEFTDGSLPNGTPVFYKVSAVCHHGLEGPMSAEATAIPAPGNILLVDDDGGTAHTGDLVRALDEGRYNYDDWTVAGSGPLALTTMQGYATLVWNLAAQSSGTLDSTDQTNLSTYLDGGGKLVLFGQDLVRDLEGTGTVIDPVTNPFLKDYLHLRQVEQGAWLGLAAGVASDPIGHGLLLPLNAPFPDRCDELTPDGWVAASFDAGSSDPVAVRSAGLDPFRAVFCAFPFEGVSKTDPDPDNQRMLIRRILEWIGVPGGSAGIQGSAYNTVVDLSWPVDLSGDATYKVYMGTAEGGPYTERASGLTIGFHRETGLDNAEAVYGVITRNTGTEPESPYSPEVTLTPTYTVEPPPTKRLMVTSTGSDLHLEWVPSTVEEGPGAGPTAVTYEVYRGLTPDFTPDTAGFSNRVYAGPLNSFADLGSYVPGGPDYYYQVTAVDAAGDRNFQ